MQFNRTKNKDVPCSECQDRDAECHARCEKYREWRAELDRKNAERRKEPHPSDLISDAKKRAIWRKSRYSRNKLLSNKYDAD